MKHLNTLLFSFFAILTAPGVSHAQINGGNHVFEFLNLPPSARIASLGGQLISVSDDDVNLAFANPALANASMHQALSFSHQFMPAGINSGYAAFGYHLDKSNLTLHGGLRYIGYGTFDLTDATDEVIGTFDAGEYALTIGAGKQLYEKLSVGANIRLISSRFESYNSLGVTADLGALYQDTASLMSFSLLLRNAGTQLSSYAGPRQPVPFEMLVGMSKRLRHMPLRFSVTYRYLDRWNVLYDDPNSQEDLFFFPGSDSQNSGNDKIDNFARHLVFSAEFLFGKKDNFRVRFGYDHLKRKEMSVNNLRSLAGFSFGLGFHISRFRIDYSRTANHLGAGISHITISTNLKQFTRPAAGIVE